MPLLNDMLIRKKKIKNRSANDILLDVSRIMEKVFKGDGDLIGRLLVATFALGVLYTEAFKLKCCSSEIKKTKIVYDHTSLMLGECGGALQFELTEKYGPGAENISQKFIEMVLKGGKDENAALDKAAEMIVGIVNASSE